MRTRVRLIWYLGAFLFASLATSAYAQDCETLSPNGQAALYWFGVSEKPLPAAIFTPYVTRRFAGQALTYSVPVGRMGPFARNAARFFQYILNDGPCSGGVTLTEVSSNAQIRFQYASSFTLWGVTRSVSCATSPYYSTDTVTYLTGWVYSNPNRSGCDSQFLMLHELYHLFGSLFHNNTSGYQLGGLSNDTNRATQCVYYAQYTPEQNAQNPCWEPMPGFYEAMRYVYRHPAGTVVQ